MTRVYTIIIVDDDNLMLQRIKKYVDFEQLGMQCVGEATDGKSGYELIVEKKPDIVIADVDMPSLSGIEMMKRVKDEGVRCKLIFLTGHAEFEYAKKAISIGVCEYLVKLVLPADLYEALQKVKTMLDEENGFPSEHVKTIETMKTYIRKNIAENITLESLSEQTFFSPNYIRNLFKTETGMGFREYLINERMQMAKKLLENTDYHVYEVVEKVGMKDIKHFTETYKKFFGKTPKRSENKK